jgi:hypothetical protein
MIVRSLTSGYTVQNDRRCRVNLLCMGFVWSAEKWHMLDCSWYANEKCCNTACAREGRARSCLIRQEDVAAIVIIPAIRHAAEVLLVLKLLQLVTWSFKCRLQWRT